MPAASPPPFLNAVSCFPRRCELANRGQLASFGGIVDWKERIAVEFLVELLAEGWTPAQILKNYAHLTDDDIRAAMHYA